MAEKTEKSVKLICSIIEQGDKQIFELEIQAKYFKDAVEAEKKIIKGTKFMVKKIDNGDKECEKQLQKIQCIKKSVEEDHEVLIKSIINHQKLKKMTNKEISLKKIESRQIKDKYQNICNEVKQKCSENTLFIELEEARVRFLKEDMQYRISERDIRIRKEITATIRDMQKQQFYINYVDMATHFIIEKKTTLVRIQKEKELRTFTKLLAKQEENKMRQKMGFARYRLKRAPLLAFGSQESTIDKPGNVQTFKIPAQPKPQVIQPVSNKPIKAAPQPEEQKPTHLKQSTKPRFNEKLAKLLNEEEHKQVVTPKINVIEQRVVIPTFVPPTPVIRKKKILSNVWQKPLKRYRSSQSSTGSQESRKSTQETQDPVHDMSQNSFDANVSIEESQPREFAIPTGLPYTPKSQAPVMKEPPPPTPKYQTERAKPKSILTPPHKVSTAKAPMGGEPSKTVRFHTPPKEAPMFTGMSAKESFMFTANATFGQPFQPGMFENTPYNESKKYKSSSLWSKFSMVKSMLLVNENINIAEYAKVRAFLKKQSVGYEPSKSKVLSREEIDRFMSEAPNKEYLMMKSQMPSENYGLLSNSLMDTSDPNLTFDPSNSNAEQYGSPESTYAIEGEEEAPQNFGNFLFGGDDGAAGGGGNEGGRDGPFSFGTMSKPMFDF